jgi:hypothetical protein
MLSTLQEIIKQPLLHKAYIFAGQQYFIKQESNDCAGEGQQ